MKLQECTLNPKYYCFLAKAFRMGQGGFFHKVFCGQKVMKKKC